MSFRVEFCGVPASGKSRLSSGLVTLLNKRGHKVFDRKTAVDIGLRKRNFGLIGGFVGACIPGWRRDFLGIPHSLNDWHHFTINYPHFVALIHDWLANSNADSIWRSCVFYSLLTSAFEFRVCNSLRYPIVFDEGFVQRFYTLKGYCGLGRVEDVARYVSVMPLPNILVSVGTDPEICLIRLKRRAELPLLLQHEPETLLISRIKEGTELIAELSVELERQGVIVMRVVGELDPEPTIEKIADCIESHISSNKILMS